MSMLRVTIRHMATFQELSGLLRNPPEEGLPESIYDDLDLAYSSMYEGSQAQIAAAADKMAELESAITALKIMNFDLLTAAGTPADDVPTEAAEEAEDEDKGIDSLLKKDDEEDDE